MSGDRPDDRPAKRPGEIALAQDPGGRADAGVAFIGRVRTPWSRDDCPKNIRAARETGRGATVEIDAPYRPGLLGLTVGQPVMLLYWMHRGRRDLIVQTPGHADGPRGAFALRSPLRPNPVSLACVTITGLDVEAGRVAVDAADCFDGTPLVDLKPWMATVDAPA